MFDNKYNSIISDFEELFDSVNLEISQKNKEVFMLKVSENKLSEENKKLKLEIEEVKKINIKLKEKILLLKKQLKENSFNEDDLNKKTVVDIFNENKENSKKLISDLIEYLEKSEFAGRYKLVARSLSEIKFLDLPESTFVNLLTLIDDETLIIEYIDENYIIDILMFLMDYKPEYEIFIISIIDKIASQEYAILKNKRNIELLVYLCEFYGKIDKIRDISYKNILKTMQIKSSTRNLLNYIKRKEYLYRYLDVSEGDFKGFDCEVINAIIQFMSKKYVGINTVQNKKNEPEMNSLNDKSKTINKTFKLNLDSVDKLHISSRIKSCDKDKNDLIRKRVKLAVYNKNITNKKGSVEASVYYCKKCNRYSVNAELIRSIYNSIDTKKDSIKFESEEGLNQVSIVNALGYNTSVEKRERFKIIEEVIIPTLGAKRLISHLKFLVNLQKNNKKDFSNAIAIWIHDIAFLEKNYN